MSYVELHTGTLTKVNIRGLTVEEYCKPSVRNTAMKLLMRETHISKP